jgi:hypothetical protein
MGEKAGGSDFLPARNSQYLDAKYWDERFQKVCKSIVVFLTCTAGPLLLC